MKILYKFVVDQNTMVNKVIEDVDYVNAGSKVVSYRLKSKPGFLYTLQLYYCRNIRIVEDSYEN